MGWLSKIFKGSDHRVASDGRSGIEAINPATAISLSNGYQKEDMSIESELQLDDDEFLSRDFRESLAVDSLSESPNIHNCVGNGYGYEDELINESLYQPITLAYSTNSRDRPWKVLELC